MAVYAHASAGCLHVRPLLNVKTARGVELLHAVGDYACELAAGYGGAMSGEHGDGLARSELNPQIFGPQLYRALQEVKAAFDPDNRMNPGKIVDAPPRENNLRYGPGYQTIALQTVFDWGPDGGYASQERDVSYYIEWNTGLLSGLQTPGAQPLKERLVQRFS